MVKADMTRDYYGDLEILPTADVADIKRQFKKLGMYDFFLISLMLALTPGRRTAIIRMIFAAFASKLGWLSSFTECWNSTCFYTPPPLSLLSCSSAS